MKPLRAWTARRMVLVWALWIGAVVGAQAVFLFWQIAAIERGTPSTRPPGSPEVFLPPQRSDFVFAVTGSEIPTVLLLVLGPPIVFTILWLRARRDR